MPARLLRRRSAGRKLSIKVYEVDEQEGGLGSPGRLSAAIARRLANSILLAAGDSTGEMRWHERAATIADHVVAWASANDWRIPEHFDATWVPQPELNLDHPNDPFKPYGATVGHGLEWSRLLLQVDASLPGRAPKTLVPAARELYDGAVRDGWSVDGAPGFVYTTDWAGAPVVHTRMHWVAAEAIGAAAALHRATDEARYAADYAFWWDYAAEFLIDRERGSWHHELDPSNVPSREVWPGKPDLYHAFQATLLPLLPLAPGLAVALRDGLLGAGSYDCH